MAHGYLISQFLSGAINKREDKYGGSAENRRRFALHVFQHARQAVGKDYPLFAKINAADTVEGGLEFAESLAAMRELDKLGIDALEISGGLASNPDKLPSRMVKSKDDEGYFWQYARDAKKGLQCPVISVGGWRTLTKVEEALSAVDAVSLSRPLISQPDLCQIWGSDPAAAARCISCNKCFMVTFKYGLDCILNRKAAKK
jgi:2,4-dienoyl-CoA reductase-like NADH-dependent reductase (Old Yellow Enzyme family)